MTRTMCTKPRVGLFSWTSFRNRTVSTKLLLLHLLCLISISQLAPQVSAGSSHRHKHGDRERVRRVGRDSPQSLSHPYVESLYHVDQTNARVTDSYAAYQVETVSPRLKGNLHKPNFTNCDYYQAEIQEGQPVNTTVIQVQAFDNDPMDAGGSITYAIEDKTDDFVIDEFSGWIRTNKIFDRDEPSREKIAYITVKATDNGRPPLADVCNLKVKILDINDNKPMFDKFNYAESVPRDIPLNQVVMRISATDIDDGNNGTVQYRLERHPQSPSDLDFFEIVPSTGEVKLVKKFDMKEPDRQYFLTAIASDKGNPPESSMTNLSIKVVEPNQKPPYFIKTYNLPIKIKERTFNYNAPIATLEARSGIENNSLVFFELINGQTQATNKDSIFSQETNGQVVTIKVDRPPLDYELVNEYTLTIRVSNRHELAATTVIKIEVEDENDEKPLFTDVSQGVVLEDEAPGTMVMRVQAIDKDGTSPNNLVSYSLDEALRDSFTIDYATGEIRTLKKFDRETQDVYSVTVIAQDGAPSVLDDTGRPNERRFALKILIADKNDNAPVFFEPKGGYRAEIAEDANIGSKVMEVKANDVDSASEIVYSIEDGDPENNFWIQSTTTTGVIYIKKALDYERVRQYELKIKASDSVYETTTIALINVTNVNDNPPEFERMNMTTTIVEESIPRGCIFTVVAYDPDIGDRSLPQNISYDIPDLKYSDSFSVDSHGCVKVIKPLDRDLPNGFEFHQVYVQASDEWGVGATMLSRQIDLRVNLDDINDNAPFLNSTNPVVWNENQPAGEIITLTAADYDEPKNGAPFTFRLDSSADAEIQSLFEVRGNKLRAIHDNFDREFKKEYLVPIQISDNGVPQQSGVSTLTVIIGDENDNDMAAGESKIFVYKYKENTTFTIGRVYVEDKDDWDLPDKEFDWATGQAHNDFSLEYENGYISMKPSAREGTHRLVFKVKERRKNNGGKVTEVIAGVNVTVKQITDEAVDNSGSIRFMGLTKEQFITPDKSDRDRSKQDKLRTEIANLLEMPEENVDVFTVINPDPSMDPNVVDVRFSAHNSPFYKPERLDGIMGQNKDRLEKALELNIVMIRIDECLREKMHCPDQGCTNVLNKSDISYMIFTNKSSFVGVNAFVTPVCKCMEELLPKSCLPNPCLYDGICRAGPSIEDFRCECREGYRGRRCELTSISFDGNGWAWYHPLSVCKQSNLDVYFNTPLPTGLLMYNGPTYKSAIDVTDFLSLELNEGRPVLLLDYGSGVLRLETPTSLADGKDHLISLSWAPNEISMSVDNCPGKQNNCFAFGSPIGDHSFLNVNGPLQVGGMSFNPNELKSFMKWNYIPTTTKFTGCISNLSLNGEFYDLGDPSFSLGNVTSCDAPRPEVYKAVVGVGLSFIIILLVCILVLLILVIAIVFYRRSRKYDEVKGEPGDDVRENIINYSDEGGGEGDQTGYDLSVLMKASNGPYPGDTPKDNAYPNGRIPPTSEGPDIGNFLQGSKNKVDNDPDGLPYDDVRNYAYEGDGNSMGSLSSLASGTDDEDLSFDFLPSFGPRFKKLADMYGGESSDEERSSRAPPEAWC